jgi:inosose dehydratase
MGVEYGFAAVASLDANPFDIKRMFEQRGLTIITWCAHANLLDPTAPWRFGTMQIIKAVRAAAAIGVEHVVTSEGDPKTEFGHNLTDKEALFLIRERLYEPLRMAEDYGVKILLEPHGKYTDSIDYMEKILELCDSPALGVNFDSSNSWLGGTDPVAMVKRLADKIEHVHWKDWPVPRWKPTAASSSARECRALRSAPASWMSRASSRRRWRPAMTAIQHAGSRRRCRSAAELRVSEVVGRGVMIFTTK